jgi:hypothetical protein
VADYYFDGVNGNDANNGLTPQTAKKTLDALNALGSVIQNKIIALRDSIIYRRSTPGFAAVRIDYNNVTLTNWYEGGSDKLPRILGSDFSITNWINVNGNIWQTKVVIGNSTLYFEFPDSIRWGLVRSSLEDLNKEFDFYISSDTTMVYCFSPSNPDTRYASVESYNRTYCVELRGNNCKVEYLQLDYGGMGVIIKTTSNNNTIQNCSINFHGKSSGVLYGCCGEGIQIWSSGNIVRNNYIQESSSHGIHIYTIVQSISNNLIEHNVVWNCHHTGYDVNSPDSLITDITIRFNVYYDTPWAAERQEPGYGGTSAGFFCNGNVNNITLAYNLFFNIYKATCAQIWGGTNINVYNNTFANTINYGTTGYGAIFGNSSTTAKNNIFVTNGRMITAGTFLSESNNLIYNMGSGGTGTISGLNADPMFNDISNYDFSLLPGSPAINLGIGLGFSEDIEGNPIAGQPDAGTLESIYDTGNYLIVQSGWNFISIPRLADSMVIDSILTDRASLVYEFSGVSYQAVNELQIGKGYAVKFDTLKHIFIEGAVDSTSIPVVEGWNLIGPFSLDVPLSQLSTSPPGIISSSFYEFTNGQYRVSDVLRVGKGYWIKVASDGIIYFNN